MIGRRDTRTLRDGQNTSQYSRVRKSHSYRRSTTIVRDARSTMSRSVVCAPSSETQFERCVACKGLRNTSLFNYTLVSSTCSSRDSTR